MTNAVTTFAELNLSSELLQSLADLQFIQPSPVQAQTIPWLIEGRDVIGQAQTGTGKTAAFALPILDRLQAKSKVTQALILAPTRELAIQVADQISALSARQPGTEVAVLCGGQDYRRQLQQLRSGAQVVVGTPGRILDHIQRGTLDLSKLRTFVLDEADEMLRMGFIEDVESILAKLPDTKQIALFSATMPSRIRQIANRYLTDPVSVEIREATATVAAIEQRFLFASVGQKPDALSRILAVEDAQGVIVFVRTKSATEEVATGLQQQGYRAMAIHGDITQALRERIIAQFRQGAIDVLVATDVAARGLDVERVTHVINYDVPHDCETYVHRIGRTGRAGRSGVTILFVTPKESRILNLIERHTRQRIEKISVPDNQQIAMAKEQRLMNQVSQRLNHEHLASYRAAIETYLKQHPEIHPQDVAAALALILNQDKPLKGDRPEFREARAQESRAQSPRTRRDDFRLVSRTASKEQMRDDFGKRAKFKKSFEFDAGRQTIYRLDVGRIHGVKPGNIVGAIANEAGLPSRQITGLKIHDDYSTVCLPHDLSQEHVQCLNKAWVCGRQLKPTALRA